MPTTALPAGGDSADGLLLASSSEYATVSDDSDELQLNLERLNDDANSEFDDVFTITADRDLEAVWIADAPEGVEFYLGDDRRATVDESSSATLEEGQSLDVGVAVDTHTARSENETFTVHAEYENDDEDDGPDQPSADVDLEDVTYSTTDLEAGEDLTVTATYHNHGETAGRKIAELLVDGVVVDEKEVTIGAGETKEVTFTRTMERSGTFEVAVDDRKPQSIAVSAGEGPVMNVTNVEIEDDEFTAGGSTSIATTVENEGNASGRLTSELAIDGVVVDDRTVELEPGEERVVTFDRRFSDAGTYDVSVSGADGGTVTVREAAIPSVANRVFASSAAVAVVPPAALGTIVLVEFAYGRRKL
ncbi:CARDB domain-containing protein [Natrialbaceae archaeon GCM10025810]|uniref:CARDB domain-containing protein n=1 Tax=Halovalidus salilacus TaxID=3075124 RepID=UPI003617D0BC